MIPQSTMDFQGINEIETTATYNISGDKIQGFADNLKALKQAIYKVLNTEKYEYPIYSFNYGIELESLIGKDPIYVKIELERRIKECLLEDERIVSVENFQFNFKGDEISCMFDIKSIFGVLSIAKEVGI